MKTTFNISPKKVSRFFLTIIFALFIGNILYIITNFYYGYSYRKIFSLFDFNGEANISTFYSVCAIIFTSVLLFLIGFIKHRQKDNGYPYWIFLGFLFLGIAYDEAAQVHENLNGIIRAYLPENTSDFLYFAWVIPYALLSFAIGLVLIKFLFNLPKRTALLFLASGAVFITGAIGMELIGSYLYTQKNTLFYHFSYTIEELLEMLGIVLFIFSILDYVKYNFGKSVNIDFNHKAAEEFMVTKKNEFHLINNGKTYSEKVKSNI